MSPNKEPRFFESSFYRNIDPTDPHYQFLKTRTVFTFSDYLRLFEGVENERAIGESTATYLYNHNIVIPRVKKCLGDVRIIILLRNPVDRAFSAYVHLLREEFEDLSFEKCLQLEEERRAARWSPMNYYQEVGLYYAQVKDYLQNFEQVNVILYDDLVRDALEVVRDTHEFLGIDTSFVPDVSVKYGVTGIPRIELLHQFLNVLTEPNAFRSAVGPVVRAILPGDGRATLHKNLKVLKAKNLAKPEMRPETREYLLGVFRDDILKLQDLLGRDLRHWLN